MANGPNVHVVWSKRPRVGPADLLFRSSANYGASVGRPSWNLSSTPTNAVFRRLAAAGSNVYVT